MQTATRNRILSMITIVILILNVPCSFIHAADDVSEANISVTRTVDKTDVIVGETITFDYNVSAESIDVETTEEKDIEIVLIMDVSGSMDWGLAGRGSSGESRISMARDAMLEFVDALKTSDNVSISLQKYGSRSEEVLSMRNLQDNFDDFETAISNMQPYSNSLKYTNIGDGMRRAYYTLTNDNDTKKYIVIMTDGEPTSYSYHTNAYDENDYYFDEGDSYNYTTWWTGYDRANNYSKKMATKIADWNNSHVDNIINGHFIAFSNDEAANKLSVIADNAGGSYEEAMTKKALEDVYKNIASDIKNQYTVKDIYFEETIPEGFEIVEMPSGFTQVGNTIQGNLDNIVYTYDSDLKQYVAESKSFSIKLKAKKVGNYVFGEDDSAYIRYEDFNEESVKRPFPEKHITVSQLALIDGVTLTPSSTEIYSDGTVSITYAIEGSAVDLGNGWTEDSYNLSENGEGVIFTQQIPGTRLSVESAGYTYDDTHYTISKALPDLIMRKVSDGSYQLDPYTFTINFTPQSTKDLYFDANSVTIQYEDHHGAEYALDKSNAVSINVLPKVPSIDPVMEDDIIKYYESDHVFVSGTADPEVDVQVELYEKDNPSNKIAMNEGENNTSPFRADGDGIYKSHTYDVTSPILSDGDLVAKVIVTDGEGDTSNNTRDVSKPENITIKAPISVLKTADKTEVTIDETITFDYTIQPDSIDMSEVVEGEKEVILVTDISGSMNWGLGGSGTDGPSRMSMAKTALLKFIEQLKDNDNINLALYTYGSSANIVIPMKDLKGNYTEFEDAINNLEGRSDSEGRTNTGDGMRKAFHDLTDSNGKKKYMIVMTDGEPTSISYTSETDDGYEYHYDADDDYEYFTHNDYTLGLEYAINMGEKINAWNEQNSREAITGYYIAFSNDEAANKLKEISDAASGNYAKAMTEMSLQDAYTEIADEVNADLPITNIYFEETIPDGFEIVEFNPADLELTIESNVVKGNVGDILYQYDEVDKQYTADSINYSVTVKAVKAGDYIFGENESSFITYDDIDGTAVKKTFPEISGKVLELGELQLIDHIEIIPSSTEIDTSQEVTLSYRIIGKPVTLDASMEDKTYKLKDFGEAVFTQGFEDHQVKIGGMEVSEYSKSLFDLPEGGEDSILLIRNDDGKYVLDTIEFEIKITPQSTKDILVTEEKVTITYHNPRGDEEIFKGDDEQIGINVKPQSPSIHDLGGDNIISFFEQESVQISGEIKDDDVTKVYIKIEGYKTNDVGGKEPITKFANTDSDAEISVTVESLMYSSDPINLSEFNDYDSTDDSEDDKIIIEVYVEDSEGDQSDKVYQVIEKKVDLPDLL